MAARAKLPDCAELTALADAGNTNRDIGLKFGVTGEAVRQALERCGYAREHKQGHGYYIPWVVRADHAGHILARRLRDYSNRSQGRPLTEAKNRLLDQWCNWMQGTNKWGVPMSVHYDRQDEEGFWLEPSRPGDRDFIHPPE